MTKRDVARLLPLGLGLALALALAAAAGAAAGARDLRCETCQTAVLVAAREAGAVRATYVGARDVAASDAVESVCEWSKWIDYAGRADLKTADMVEQCERLRDEMAEELEDAVSRDGAARDLAAAARAEVCAGVCAKAGGLWAEGDDPGTREGPAERNERESAAFLEDNAGRDGVVTTASGLQYRVVEGDGSGQRPTYDDTVRVHYRGELPLTGAEFDSSYSRGEPAEFPVGGVIRGWSEALVMMGVGDVWELFIPAELAYGISGSGDDIGPNQALKFRVELLAVVTADELQQSAEAFGGGPPGDFGEAGGPGDAAADVRLERGGEAPPHDDL